MLVVKVGILGSGFIENIHMEVYKEIPDAKIVAVCSKTPAHVEAFSKKWGIPKIYTQIEDLTKDPDVEVVDIGLPHYLHKDAAILAAENNKHVICEKILARNAKEAKIMLDSVRKAGVIHCYAECMVYMPIFTKMKEIVNMGGVGKVFWMRGISKFELRLHPPGFRWNPEQCGGGVLSDTGPHYIEIMRKIVNEPPAEVFAFGPNLVLKEQLKAEDNAFALIKFQGGQVGQVETSWSTVTAGLMHKIEIFGDKGSIIWPYAGFDSPVQAYTLEGLKYVAEKVEIPKGLVYPLVEEPRYWGSYHMLKHFIECIEKGETPNETFEDGYIINEIVDAAYRSMRSGEWEKVKTLI